jgi:hypothetical protein
LADEQATKSVVITTAFAERSRGKTSIKYGRDDGEDEEEAKVLMMESSEGRINSLKGASDRREFNLKKQWKKQKATRPYRLGVNLRLVFIPTAETRQKLSGFIGELHWVRFIDFASRFSPGPPRLSTLKQRELTLAGAFFSLVVRSFLPYFSLLPFPLARF